MATEKDEPMALILSLYDDDDAEDRFCKNLMQALVDGSRTPSQIATDLDAWVVKESSDRLQKFSDQPDLIQKDGNGHVLRTSMPNASGYVERFFQSFPSLCSVFPPHHGGQTRIIQFLEALLAIPDHEAPDSFAEGGSHKDVNKITLWSDRGYSTEYLRVGADAIGYSGSGIETPDSESETRWRNYQSTIARITLTGFSECGFTSALRDILPSGKKYPSFNVRVASKPDVIGGHILAAAQWLIWPDEARYVYQQCRKKEKTDKKNPRDTWSMENWRIWKAQFQLFAWDERVDPRARDVAKKAIDRIIEVEEKDGSS
ncbi:uncharacterized protein GGS22DRAFT_151830 [Annulohypoxylon maeteangense]|uniref:uncharacterized protein n=1 Tax=Annulohypoxylon maeteangense TaxID=1927788 RepID=UPI002007ECDC|nr:uncharacterized protein GGS22DRAFT_151830 [Annulohypoxylon maeteangense]KAI0888557.1 hypothetical protein GGS22DRAFT_151830 [Annulohypoxylon maeteangense]